MAHLVAEDIVLLAFDPQNGYLRARHDGRLDAAVACALIVECQLMGAVATDSGFLVAYGETGDPLLDEVVRRIRGKYRLQSLKQWVVEIASRRFGARGATLRQLVAAGIIVQRRDRLAGLIPVTRFALVDLGARARVEASLREVLVNDRHVNDRSALVIALLSGAGLIDLVLPRELRELGRARADAIASGEIGAQAVAQVLRDAQNAAAGSVAAIVGSATFADGGAAGHSSVHTG